MEKANRTMSAEVEHQNKMGVAGRKWARDNQVETASPPSNQLTQPSSSQTPHNESTKSKKGSKAKYTGDSTGSSAVKPRLLERSF